MPLFTSNSMAEIWDSQRKHLPCMVDHLGVQLYEQTGTLLKGDHLLQLTDVSEVPPPLNPSTSSFQVNQVSVNQKNNNTYTTIKKFGV